MAKIQRLPANAGRKPQFYVDHYRCTDWFMWQQDYTNQYAIDPGAGQWIYLYTQCDYVDSFWVDDGQGYGPGGGGGGNNNSGRDNLLQGCKTEGATAKHAEGAHVIDNPGFEWAGFILQDGEGTLYYSQGELLSLSDNLADIGSPSDHSFPYGYTVVGYYHSHPDRPPSYIDDTTHGHFSASDESYANTYHINAYVMLLWNDTSSGTTQQHTEFLRWMYNGDPGTSGETDQSSLGC